MLQALYRQQFPVSRVLYPFILRSDVWRSEPGAEEHEGGLVPRLRKAPGLATEPAVEFGGQGRALLGMRWG